MKDNIVWKSIDGRTIACTEKIKVMQQNLDEIKQIAQDAFEDAILMEIAPEQIRQYLMEIITNLKNPYNK